MVAINSQIHFRQAHKQVPENESTILKPHRQEVTVGSHGTVSSPQQQTIFSCAFEPHKKVGPRSRNSKKIDSSYI